MKKKVLTLTISKKWFDMILSGEKTEEYMWIKPYWVARLFQCNSNIFDVRYIASVLEGRTDLLKRYIYIHRIVWKPFTHVPRYYPKTYDKGGWNIQNVKYWLDCLMPKEIEL